MINLRLKRQTFLKDNIRDINVLDAFVSFMIFKLTMSFFLKDF